MDDDGSHLFSASACQTGFAGFTANVRMESSTDGPLPEPQIGFDAAWGMLDTTAARRMMNSWSGENFVPDGTIRRGDSTLSAFRPDPTHIQGRGVLSLTVEPNMEYDSDYSPDAMSLEQMPTAPGRNPCLYLFNYANSTTPLGESANENLVALMQDVLRESKSLAVALEAVFSTVRQTLYYNGLPRLMGPEHKVSVVLSVEAQYPTRWIGFGFVMGGIALHWLLLLLGGILFRERARSTMLGNAWQAIAQMVTDETMPLLEQADGMEDKEVADVLRKTGRDKESMGVLRSRARNRVELGELYRD